MARRTQFLVRIADIERIFFIQYYFIRSRTNEETITFSEYIYFFYFKAFDSFNESFTKTPVPDSKKYSIYNIIFVDEWNN